MRALSIVLGAWLISACDKPARECDCPAQESQLPAGAMMVRGTSVADIAAKATPSVVQISSERTGSVREPFYEHYFGTPEDRTQRGLGSGVIIAADGVILTNNHVVAGADTIRVGLQDGRELVAKVVGTDPPSDLAVLRVDAKDLPAITIADSSRTRIGDVVLAVGNPFGLGQTVTMGIISAVGRANIGITDYEDFIQTDAAINPGNSGGALVDMEGRLIGINTAIASRTGGYQGVGFAIPSNMALQVKQSILEHGKVKRGYVGIAIQDLTPELVKSLKLSATRGVLVSDVTPGSPAANAGIRRGDVITAIDGKPTTTSAHLRNSIALSGEHKRIELEIDRDGERRTVAVVLVEAPSGRIAPSTSFDEGLLGGLSVQPLDHAMREQLQVAPNIEGVVVTRVAPGSALARVGLRAGDIILEVNRQRTKDVAAFQEAARSVERGLVMLVYRDGKTAYLSLGR